MSDKRRLFVAREFSAVLKAAAREANTTTKVLREPWNGHDLETAAKNTPARATRPHVSLLAQVTAADLRRHLTNTDVLDGFVNRFLLAGLRRSKSLPASRSLANEALTDVATRVGLALKHAKVAARLTRDKKAAELWASVYDELNTRGPRACWATRPRAALRRWSASRSSTRCSTPLTPSALSTCARPWPLALLRGQRRLPLRELRALPGRPSALAPAGRRGPVDDRTDMRDVLGHGVRAARWPTSAPPESSPGRLSARASDGRPNVGRSRAREGPNRS